jgi:hypothetical protein
VFLQNLVFFDSRYSAKVCLGLGLRCGTSAFAIHEPARGRLGERVKPRYQTYSKIFDTVDGKNLYKELPALSRGTAQRWKHRGYCRLPILINAENTNKRNCQVSATCILLNIIASESYRPTFKLFSWASL